MKITGVEAIGLSLQSGRDIADSTQDALLIKIDTDEGLSGIGEADTSPLIGKAVLDAPVSGDKCQGLRNVLLGKDPFDISRAVHPHRGWRTGVCAMGIPPPDRVRQGQRHPT